MRLFTILLLAGALAAQNTHQVTVIPNAADSSVGRVRFNELRSNGANYLDLIVPDLLGGNRTVTFPDASVTLMGRENAETVTGVKIFQGTTEFRSTSDTTESARFTGSGTTKWIYAIGDTANERGRIGYWDGASINNVMQIDGITTLFSGAAGDVLRVSDVDTAKYFYVTPEGALESVRLGYWDGANVANTVKMEGTWTSWDLRPETDNTYLLGDSSYYYQTAYLRNIDAAPGGILNNYTKVRKLEIADAAGGTSFWDIQATANGSVSSSLYIRDNGGNNVINFVRQASGSPVDYADVYVDLLPDTNLGQSLGASSKRWNTLYVEDIDFSGTFTGTVPAPANMVTTDTAQDITGAKTFKTATTGFQSGSDYTEGIRVHGATFSKYLYVIADSSAESARIGFWDGASGANTIEFDGDVDLLNGGLSVYGSILPTTTADLGASGARWNNLHLAAGLYMDGSQMIDSSRNVGNVNNLTVVGSVSGGAATFTSLTLNPAGSIQLGATTAGTLSASDRTVYAKSLYIGAFGSSPVEVIDASRNATVVDLTVTGTCTGCADSAAFVTIATDQTITGEKTFDEPVLLANTYGYEITGTGLTYFPSASAHIAYYKAAGSYDYYWRKSDNGYPGGSNEATLMSLSDNGRLTVFGSIYPSGTVDLGASGSRWNNVHLNSGIYMAGSQVMDSSRNVANVNNITAVGAVSGGAATFTSLTLNPAGSIQLGGTTAGTLSASDRTVYAKSLYIGAFGSSPVEVIDASRNASVANLTVSGTCTGCAPDLSSYVAIAGSQTITGQKTFSASVLPSGSVDLGALGTAWNNVFLTSGIYMGGTAVMDGSRNLGNINNITAIGSVSGGAASFTGLAVAGSLQVGGSATSNTLSSSIRDVYARTVSIGAFGSSVTVIDASRNATVANLTVTGTCSGCSSLPSNYVTTDSPQTISGQKTFSNSLLASGGAALGSIGTPFSNVWLSSAIYMNGSAVMDGSRNMGNINNFTAIGSVSGGAATFTQLGLTAGSLTIGGFTAIGSDRTHYGPSGFGGASSTLSCPSGQAVKTIIVSGGIVTSVTCGTI